MLENSKENPGIGKPESTGTSQSPSSNTITATPRY